MRKPKSAMFIPSEKTQAEVGAKRYHSAIFSDAKKQKSDLTQICGCEDGTDWKEMPLHTVGYHKAVMEAVR